MDEKSLYSGVTVIILTKEDVKKSLRDILNNLTDSQKNQPFIKISILEPEEVDIDNVDSSKFENQQVYTKQLQKMEGKAVGKLITKGSKEGDFETFRKKFENRTTTLKEFFRTTMKKGNTFKYYTASIKIEDLLHDFPFDLLSLNEGLEDEFNGINTVWLYAGCAGSSFETHLEDGNQRSLNYQVFGKQKVWYGVDKENIPKVQDFLRKKCKYESEMCPVFHRHKQSFIDMAELAKENIPVYKVVQNPGDIIITNSFHQGVNLGYNLNVAINIFLGIKEEINFISRGGHCPADCKYDNKSLILNDLKRGLNLELSCQVDGCDKMYISANGLNKHLKKEHGQKIETNENQQWKCSLCGENSKKPEDHIRSKHLDALSVHCTLCRKIFQSKMALKKHWRESHKTDRKCKVKKCKAEAEKFDDIVRFHFCPQQTKNI